jgi:hypothetical protein
MNFALIPIFLSSNFVHCVALELDSKPFRIKDIDQCLKAVGSQNQRWENFSTNITIKSTQNY